MATQSQTVLEPAYLAVPASGAGPGVLLLHAWWGLNSFFKGVCDRLAQAGFVAAAPDLFDGRIATTVPEAQQLAGDAEADPKVIQDKVLAAHDALSRHPAVRGAGQGVLGCSFGADWALVLSKLRPEAVRAVVLFYGAYPIDFSAARAAYLGHFASEDDFVAAADVQKVEANLRAAGREVTFHTYPGTRHWFFESDRAGYYDPAAAELAWQRTVEFL